MAVADTAPPTTRQSGGEAQVLAKLSMLDRFLPLWIGLRWRPGSGSVG